jgi:hypothetical protein
MSNPIDDAFKIADQKAAREKALLDKQTHDAVIYDQQVQGFVQSLVEAVRLKAEEFNNHPRNTEKAAIMPGGTQITIRRASSTGYPDRRIEITFRQDLVRLAWKYEVTPNPVYSEYQEVNSRSHNFHVVGEGLHLEGVNSPEGFANMVLGQFIDDCAADLAGQPRT